MPRERTRHVMTDVENGRALLDFPLSKKLGKIIFEESHNKGKKQKKQNNNAIKKRFTLVCTNMCVSVLVLSFSMGNIWYGEIWPVSFSFSDTQSFHAWNC